MNRKLNRFHTLTGFPLLFLLMLTPPCSLGQQPSSTLLSPTADPMNPQRLSRTIEGLKRTEKAMYLFERVEREESWKDPTKSQPDHVKVSRVFPAGTGIDHILLSDDGSSVDDATYRRELEKLLKTLEWAAAPGRDQTKAYAKIDKKLNDRYELIDATRTAFIYTFAGQELRDGRTLLKFHIEPNPDFKPQNRDAGFLTKVEGYVWIDEATSQLARVEGRIIDDISFGIFLGKIYKGSHFMQERFPDPSGVWLPSVSQYDFDGRKFFSSVSIHEKTYYKDYRRVGPPKEALALLRSELARLKAEPSASAGAAP